MPQRLIVVPPYGKRDEDISLEGLACIKFTATWCGPCHAIQPFYEELAAGWRSVACYLVDVDRESDVVDNAGVGALPTFVLLQDGAEIDRVEGADEARRRQAFRAAATLSLIHI